VPPELFEGFLGDLSILSRRGELGGGVLLVALEGSEGVEGWVGSSVDDRGEASAFGPEFVDAAAGSGSAP
jgi:hypothetical protein